jgi:Mn-dependent DtxR family transcriptional regulator/diadenosine tetraphosphate (Ap4A) HIT family hydrolase
MTLKFRADVAPKVRDGNVTMQFGLWRRPRVVAGRVYVVPGVGTLRVTAVEKVDLSRITPWEAEASGAEGVPQLLDWLREEKPDADVEEGWAYRVRFRFLGPETVEAKEDGTEGAAEDAAVEAPKRGERARGEKRADKGAAKDAKQPAAKERTPAPTVQPKPIPSDLMQWFARDGWHGEFLGALRAGVWRNADDIASQIKSDSATVRRRLGDLRKRGLVTSHRHHGYRITPEGQGALAGMSEGKDADAGTASTSVAAWTAGRKDGSDVLKALGDGEWHNADGVAKALALSVVSVQRRVAALRDRGLVESHRRRGYRLTEQGRSAVGPVTVEASGVATSQRPVAEERAQADASDGAVEAPLPEQSAETPVATAEVPARPKAPETPVAPIPASLLEWLAAKPYRRDILLAMRPGRYISSGELSEALSVSVTALHGRLKTLKERDLVDAAPRLGYTPSPLGERAASVLRAMASKGRNEPAGAEAFLRAEPPGWGDVSVPAPAAPVMPVARAVRALGVSRLAPQGECGFCRATSRSPARQGWVRLMQTYLEGQPDPQSKTQPIPCSRGVFEDAHWFLIVERDPLAEGHGKLICKEHVVDLIELDEWASRDARMAAVRDALGRDLPLAAEVVASQDPRIVDVTVVAGLEHGVHLCFDLIPRYRLDLPGVRPLASIRSHYDDLSLVRKRKLWEVRREHLQEIAGRLREAATSVLRLRAVQGVNVSEP